jgi:hypothetical protein
MANLLQEAADDLSRVSDRTSDDIVAAINAVSGFTALIPGIASVQDDLAALINGLSEALDGLELDLRSIVENLGVPQGQVDAVLEVMALASSLANLSQLIAAQLGSATANEITQQVQRIGGLVDLVDTVDGFTDGLRDQIRDDLDTIAAALSTQ